MDGVKCTTDVLVGAMQALVDVVGVDGCNG